MLTKKEQKQVKKITAKEQKEQYLICGGKDVERDLVIIANAFNYKVWWDYSGDIHIEDVDKVSELLSYYYSLHPEFMKKDKWKYGRN